MKINYIKLPNTTEEIIVSVIFNAGKIFAPSRYPELSHLVEHLIANKLLRSDYTYEAMVGIEECVFSIYLSKKGNFKQITNFFDFIYNSQFNTQELELEKKIIAKELLEKFDRIENQMYELAIKNRFKKNTPYSNSQYPKVFTDEIDMEMVNKFYKNHFCLENCTINIGSYTIDKDFQKLISSLVADQNYSHGTKKNKPLSAPYSNYIITQKTQATNSLYLTLNWPSFRIIDSLKNRVSMQVVMDYLIGDKLAIVFHALRDKGLIYGCYWHSYSLEQIGVVSINLSTEQNQVIECLQIIFDEIKKVKQSTIDIKKIEQIKKYLIKRNRQLKMNNLSYFESKYYDIYYNDVIGDKKFQSLIKSITISDVINVSRKIFDHKFLNILMIGPKVATVPVTKFVKRYF